MPSHKREKVKNYLQRNDNFFQKTLSKILPCLKKSSPQCIYERKITNPAAKPKPKEIKLQNAIPCSKYKMEAMRHLVLHGINLGWSRKEAMDYLAADVISSAGESQQEVLFYPGTEGERRRLIADDRLEEMKNIVNQIAQETREDKKESSKGYIETARTFETAEFIRGNFDYTNILLDDILKNLDVYTPHFVEGKNKNGKEQMSDYISNNSKRSTSNDDKYKMGENERMVQRPSSLSSGTKSKAKKRTVGTQTVHPELMDLILKLLSQNDELKECKRNYGKCLCPNKSRTYDHRYIIKHSVATQTGSCIERPISDKRYSKQMYNADAKSPTKKVKIKRSKSATNLTIKKPNNDLKCKCAHRPLKEAIEPKRQLIKTNCKGKVDACTQVRERKRLIERKKEIHYTETLQYASTSKKPDIRVKYCMTSNANVLQTKKTKSDRPSIPLSRCLSKSNTELNEKQNEFEFFYTRMSDDEKLKYINKNKEQGRNISKEKINYILNRRK